MEHWILCMYLCTFHVSYLEYNFLKSGSAVFLIFKYFVFKNLSDASGSVGLADLRVLHPPVVPERRDFGGSLADPPGKFCAVVDIGTNFPPFMKYSCTDCPEGTGNTDSKKTVQLMWGGRERCTWSSVDAQKPRWPLHPGVVGGPCDAFHNLTSLQRERNTGPSWRGTLRRRQVSAWELVVLAFVEGSNGRWAQPSQGARWQTRALASHWPG